MSVLRLALIRSETDQLTVEVPVLDSSAHPAQLFPRSFVTGRVADWRCGRVGRFGPHRSGPAPPPRTEVRPIDNTYNAQHLLVLEGLEAVRKRPGMYIGSTDTRGLMHCLWEIIDNAVDEALGGHCTRVDVTLHPDGSAEVHDNGRGIPVDKEPKTGLSGVEVVFTKLHAGGKFGGGSYAATGGLHGVGSSVVNALSARLDVEVDRSPATQQMSFQRGVPGVFAGEGPTAPFDAAVGAAQGQAGQEGRDRHPDPVLARPADLHQGREVHLGRAGHARPADLVHRARPRAHAHRPARRRAGHGVLPPRRRHH